MGIIQNAINQALGTAAIATRLSPGLEEKSQIRALNRDVKRLNKVSEQLEETGATEQNVPHLEEQVIKTDELLAEKYERLAQLKPTQANIENIYKPKQYVENMRKENKKATDRQNMQQEQRQSVDNFKKFITDKYEVEEAWKGRNK